MSHTHRIRLRDKVREMFDHGFGNYMQHAFPEDELNPILCKGRSKDANPDNWALNDVLGNFSLTLVDSLDTLAIMGNKPGFEHAVRLVIHTVSFDLDSRVQVFEVTIRVLGGLLSAHILATDPQLGFQLDWYRRELLDLARDLGDRLMPAFNTPTRMPHPRVNLRRGVLKYETPQSCTAGIGTLILEFGVLSRLTGDPKYEKAARDALWSLWESRSNIDLLGNTINVLNNHWIETYSGIGAGMDSFYEYLLKAHILFGDQEYLLEFDRAYAALMNHVRDGAGFIYKNVNMYDGKLATSWIDSLAAFFPGLQVLAGDIESAIKHHYTYYTIWQRYGALPERFDLGRRDVSIPVYPLRPEFAESTYMLYQATQDPFYLEVGERILDDIESACRVNCGFVALMDVRSGAQDDRMESFFLSETLKYLYLLFDTDNFVNKMDSNFVFTTEGHFLSLPRRMIKHRSGNSATCPNTKTTLRRPMASFTHAAPLSRSDTVICHNYIGYVPQPPTAEPICSPRGLYLPTSSSRTTGHAQSSGQQFYVNVPKRPGTSKITARIVENEDGLLANSIEDMQLILEHSPYQESYRLVGVGSDMPLGEDKVLRVLDTGIPFLHETGNSDWRDTSKAAPDTLLPPPVHAVITIDVYDHEDAKASKFREPKRVQAVANLADYGPWLFHGMQMHAQIVPLLTKSALDRLKIMVAKGLTKQQKSYGYYRATSVNLDTGCGPLLASQARHVRGRIVIVKRGGCQFVQKVEWMQMYGAVGVVIASTDNNQIKMMPSEPLTMSEAIGRTNGVDTIDIPAMFVTKAAAKRLLKVIPLSFADHQTDRDAFKPKSAETVASQVQQDAANSHASIFKSLLRWSWLSRNVNNQPVHMGATIAKIQVVDTALAYGEGLMDMRLIVAGRPINNIQIIQHAGGSLESQEDADLNFIKRGGRRWPTVRRVGWRGSGLLDPGTHLDCLEQCPAGSGTIKMDAYVGRLLCCARIRFARQ